MRPGAALGQEKSGESTAEDSAAVALPAIQVTEKKDAPDGSSQSGYRYEDASVGPLGRANLKDTPYSINVTSGELIENRSAHSEYEALKTNPAVSSLMESTGYSSMSRVMIRGFTAADQNDLRDGLVDRSFTLIPFENVERVEVLNGFSSFLSGFSDLGGTINYVTKQPPASMYAAADTGIYGGSILFARADVGGPVQGTDGKLSFRVNAAKEGGATYLEDSEQQRGFISGIVKYQPTPDTTLKIDFWNQNFTLDGLQSYVNVNPGAGVGVPSAASFSARKQYGQPWTYNDAEKTQAGIFFDSKLSDVFTLRAAFRYADMWREYKFVDDTLTAVPGVYKESATTTPRQFETTRSAYALMDADFDTAGLKHHLTFGYSGTGFVFRRGADIVTALGTTNLAAPGGFVQPFVALGPSNQYNRQDMDNLVVGDRIELTDKFSVLGGATYAMDYASSWGGGTTASTLYQTAVTPSAALMFKPRANITTYVSYMEGLATGGTAPNTYNGVAVANAGQMLGPSVSRQVELGSKATFGRVDLAAALFYIDKINELVDPGDMVYKQQGREVHQGLEFNASGKLTDGLSLTGGFTLMDARVQSTNDPTVEGKIPVNVPEQQARLYLEYVPSFARDFTAVAGVFYNGRRPVDSQNVSFLSDSTTFDVGLRYQPRLLGHDFSLNLMLQNVFDTAYWAYYRSGDGLFLGEPRTIALTLRATW